MFFSQFVQDICKKDNFWISSTPFNDSCNNQGKDSPPNLRAALYFRCIPALIRLQIGREREGVGYTYSYPKHLLLRRPHLHRAMYSHPYQSISVPVYIQCQCKNLAIDLLRNTPPSPNIARSSLNPGHNWFDAGFSNSNRKMRADQPLDKVTDA